MRFKFSLLAAVYVAIAGSSADAQEHTFKFGHAAASTHLFHDGLEMFAEKVSQKTDGKVEIEVYGDRQLGDDRQLLEGLQIGTIDGALVSAPTLPLAIGATAFDALQLPFLVGSYEEMSTALTSDVGNQLLDSLASHSLKGLGYIEAGQRHFLARSTEVTAVEDFEGLKTRIVPTPLHEATWEAMGTNPIGLAYGEVYSALETGTIDAVEINLSSIQTESLYEAAKNVALTGHYFWPGVLMMNGSKFDALSADVKTAILEAGQEVIGEHYALAASQEAETAEALEENDVTIVELEDVDAMRERAQPVLDEWTSKDPLIGAFVEQVKGQR